MARARFNDEQKSEIARRYKAGETLDDLASAFKCCKSTVSRRLKAAGVPRRTYSLFTAEAIQCPYSDDALRLMYWKRGMSVQDIADHATLVLQRGVWCRTVTRWLRAANVTLRTLSEAQALRAKLTPEQFVAPVKAMAVSQRPVPAEFRTIIADRMRQVQKLGAKAAARSNRRTETRRCAFCGRETTRRPSEFHRPPESTYCSRACTNRATKQKATT